jgi:hypothetical protein
MTDRLSRVRELMEAFEGTEYGPAALRALAEQHPQAIERDDLSLELLNLVEPAQQWAILCDSGLVSMNDFLTSREDRTHVRLVADEAYEEIDSKRPADYWVEREIEAYDQEIGSMVPADEEDLVLLELEEGYE